MGARLEGGGAWIIVSTYQLAHKLTELLIKLKDQLRQKRVIWDPAQDFIQVFLVPVSDKGPVVTDTLASS